MRYRCILTLVLILVLTACGSKGASAPTASQPTPSPFPTYEFVSPTAAISAVVTGAATSDAGTALVFDPDKVAAGKSRYEALACGDCHGADAKGTSKGKALVPSTLTEDQFIDYLRSGGKLGNDHLYSTNRLSDTGSKNLYLYILSLSASK